MVTSSTARSVSPVPSVTSFVTLKTDSGSSDSDGYGAIENGGSFDSSSSEETSLLAKGPASRRNRSSKTALEITDRRHVELPRSLGIVLFGTLIGIVVVFLGGLERHYSHNGIRKHDNENNNDVVPSSGGESKFRWSDLKTFGISPVDDFDMLSINRAYDALPSAVWGSHLNTTGHPLPTNSWYLNLVSQKAASWPDDQTRVYTVPYFIDTESPREGMEGLRVHMPYLQASKSNIQMVDDFTNMIFLGAEGMDASDSGSRYRVKDGPLSNLGVGLEWLSGEDPAMSTNIVRGMPYVTMEYTNGDITPTIYSLKGLASDVQIDREEAFEPVISNDPTLGCMSGSNKVVGADENAPTTKKSNKLSVQKHLHLHFVGSDFTWIVFFSKPVEVSCEAKDGQDGFKLSIHNSDDKTDETNLVVRMAMLNQCTTGSGNIHVHCEDSAAMADLDAYERLLKASSHVVPGSPTIDFEYSTATAKQDESAKLHIDWDASTTNEDTETTTSDLLVFALPHHQESLSESVTDLCFPSLHGPACLVKDSKWVLEEALGAPLSFFAPRPPTADLVPAIAEALHDDIMYKLGDNILRGATDTYFSGKTLARVARVLMVAEELGALADASSVDEATKLYSASGDDKTTLSKMVKDSMKAASKAKLPTSDQRSKLLEDLRTAVTVWLRSNSEAPYLYDKSWGGLVNCGCKYEGEGELGTCANTFPECPALESVNEDFGNGYYNDHHYHYGYHVYAAAVVARFDPEWGRKHFDEVMLYIRDFANPNGNDAFFPQYRQKDWYLGSSWASGFISAENSPHGRNEESSSEAISAYEGVVLYGAAMVDAFGATKEQKSSDVASKLETAKLIRDSGQMLAASEIHATNRYWHVWSSDTHNNTYPEAYKQPVVGMLYDSMAQFGTWFSNWPVVSYGIQLIPLTPVTETRDDPAWATELYPKYKAACEDAGDFCTDNGWSIFQAGLLATAGDREGAVKTLKAVDPNAFETDGGGGNTMSNTLWYIATRKDYVA